MEDLYKTCDYYLIAYLIAKGHIIEKVEKPQKKAFFYFQDTSILRHHKNLFFNDGLVGITQLVSAFRKVKGKIYDMT